MPNRMQHLVKDALASLVKSENVNNDVMKSALTAVREEAVKQLDEIYTLARSGKGEKALRRVRRFVEKSAPPEEPDWVCPSLDMTFEVLVYPFLMKKKIEGKRYFPAPVPMGLAYHLWGKILLELGKEEDAQKRFQQSLEWNPFNGSNYAFLNRFCEKKQDWDGWLKNIRSEYGTALYEANLMESYAELGRYLIRRGEEEKGQTCLRYVLAHLTEDTFPPALDAEMKKQAQGEPDAAAFDAVCREYGLASGPDKAVIAAITEVAEAQAAGNSKEAGAAMYHHLYGLTGQASYEDKARSLQAAADEAKTKGTANAEAKGKEGEKA
jgi:tetratricopeptide (TPR) repeat protein